MPRSQSPVDTAQSPPPTTRQDLILQKHLAHKGIEWTAIAHKTEPLQLLDLPVDILQAILREVTHTNDLTSLALAHSTLHNLVTPLIYSRFDIVWPDASATAEPRTGVDALTFGLATLVMAQDVLGEAPYQQHTGHKCEGCGHENQKPVHSAQKPRKIRRGNYFAQFTRKFSLGNGPAEWVQEYLITKEGGKMLGTLVALAIGRMRNLEAFVWDMPTGVLRDVWLALASLGNRDDGQECRLDRIWVRWHDNQEQGPLTSPPPPGLGPVPTAANIPSLIAGGASYLFQIPPYPRVEFPTFSILPPLRSLSVMDIDELPYVEEMSILIERSLPRMRELRVGVASHAQFDNWVRPAEDRIASSIMMTADEPKSRPGGILGILVSRFCDEFAHTSLAPAFQLTQSSVPNTAPPTMVVAGPLQASGLTGTPELTKVDEVSGEISDTGVAQLSSLLSAQTLQDEAGQLALQQDEVPPLNIAKRVSFATPGSASLSRSVTGLSESSSTSFPTETLYQRLHLEILELERVHLSVNVLSRAIDWSQLISLTLLGCRNHEQLWKALRKKFTPANRSRTSSYSITSPMSESCDASDLTRRRSSRVYSMAKDEYPLKLRRLHTDTVSAALIVFLKDTLAPDSLEWLFLQESSTFKSNVTIDTIYRGAIKRHRGSLRKLLIDSHSRNDDENPPTSWRRWVYSRELLTCITSSRMQLRELSLSIEYKDWHFFLQRLPNATHIRSLHIVHIADHIPGRLDSREAAMQVLDIVALRPELELCYLGVQGKCFEILEACGNARSASRSTSPVNAVLQDTGDSDDNDDLHDEQQHDDVNDSDGEMTFSHGEDSEDEAETTSTKPSFRLREILFYDDKVSIFKARHGKL